MDYEIANFYGINTAIKDPKALKPGYAIDSLNWVTSKENDSIALRRGYARLGQTEVTGDGEVTGIGVATGYNGNEQLWFSYDRKLKYYNVVTDDVVEVGSDMLPEAADGEDTWFQPYAGLGGAFILFGSPNSSVYKIPVANPGDAVDQLTENYRWGVFHVGQNRAFTGQRNGTVSGNNDPTGFYLSYIDKDQLSDFTSITAEAVVTFPHTLTARTGAETVAYIYITDGVEIFKDDRNGNLVGSAGGVGTVNYATGVINITSWGAGSAGGAITVDYYTETSTSGGLLDFTGGANGQGKSFRQDDAAGKLMAIFNINTTQYCFHENKTWQFQSSLDDTQSTNLPYRNVGIPHIRAAWQTPDGIIFADVSRANEPKYRRMEVLGGTDINTIEPKSISDALDLTSYVHDTCVAYRWGDYEIFCVQKKVLGIAEGFNSIMWVHNVVSDAWDKFNYYASCLAELDGALVAGDSISNNVYTLFSGFDEDGDIIENHWISSTLDLGMPNLKTCRRMVVEGLIQPDQQLAIDVSYNGGAWTTVFTVDGQADYVDSGIEISIGSRTIGTGVIGGGAEETASSYEIDFPLNSDRFVDVAIRLRALAVGYVSLNAVKFKDIRNKGLKNIPVRTR